MADVLLRMKCRGHGDIRATHGKTLEFAVDPEITARATCVVGVAAEVVEPGAPGIAGPVRITIGVGDRSATVRAVANSMWRPGTTAVVRRSSERLANTLATDADLAASTLPRDLLDGLRDPESEVDITVERDTEAAGGLVLFHARESGSSRLAAEVASADHVLVEDQPARALVAAVKDADLLVADARKADRGKLRAALESGERVLVVSAVSTRSDLVAELAATEDAPFEVLGLPAQLAVAAICPSGAPVLLVDDTNRRAIVKAVRRHTNAAVVFRCAADQLPGIVEEAGERRVALLPAGTSERPWLGTTSELPSGGSTEIFCCLAPVAAAGEDTDVDAPGLIRALLAQGVSQKTISRALIDSAGWSRRQAYDLVLSLTDDSE
ncbi:hypothetical protein SAMN05421805_106139 [Saccharopolyspora antimicrobica]|uniref:DUF371 domain-containing protein n=1 Tax=Saccharopolyspora antimicrobica TaxID=455193 RepID=A0A1I5B6V1_9PSEU|nr:DUF371 domain-containing protein [Saccharopolyspora antimicrobica]RKT86487.1 hypothetical protein ATL45_4864 [Saccharopolyspora antimicrobica]SFN70433.1 hypothetical protein SAMN05421805_106139 [Saccharopolyspora antimicrobica]